VKRFERKRLKKIVGTKGQFRELCTEWSGHLFMSPDIVLIVK
jgi:hypothetical protein